MGMEIWLPILIVGALALLGGIILAVSSVFMAVPVNENEKKIREVLPGANCGGCGYAGCDEYAAAIAKGNAPAHLCGPGGASVAEKIGKITGLGVIEVNPKTAVVYCCGSKDKVDIKMNYRGIQTCAAASTFYGGISACTYGCMGLGDCVRACVYDAISIQKGVAVVNQGKCTGCSSCAKACPKGLIKMVKTDVTHIVLCSSHDKGATTVKTCKAGCIGCGKCVRTCPSGAITLDNNLAVIDPAKCTSCGACVPVCPTGAIKARSKSS
ncbi:MAG TPA: RnfABCDGE type electron transport complex subunit B [Oscillospiraceae bacterium]|nr:RnfABCDGE type electron transport complex subunit B [Oscillospiraceae bacterium]HPF54914.1 RnfABCDGE type electron transport complex subunit B [Clostridiales bacterium]HPK34973.1 RnfABCDGE type electron transport complex subunit B [Oscillospiraceae bacterium]HPR75531.1 RnfABCDGE type electron transport complex subunit B [Oscillospiraceae bacterium]